MSFLISSKVNVMEFEISGVNSAGFFICASGKLNLVVTIKFSSDINF